MQENRDVIEYVACPMRKRDSCKTASSLSTRELMQDSCGDHHMLGVAELNAEQSLFVCKRSHSRICNNDYW